MRLTALPGCSSLSVELAGSRQPAGCLHEAQRLPGPAVPLPFPHLAPDSPQSQNPELQPGAGAADAGCTAIFLS